MSKTILITGATDGIGLRTAEKLVAAGHRVLLHGRSDEKLSVAAERIGGATERYRADLAQPDDVAALASAVRAAHRRIDALINNAGVLKAPEPRAATGRDIRFEVNTIAPYALTLALLPILPARARVVNLSSAAQTPVDPRALRGEIALGDMAAYSQSKRALTLWTVALARARPGGPVFVAVNPGSLLATKMVKQGFGIPGNDLDIGADILCRAALSEDFDTASGRYYDNDSGGFSDPGATDAEIAALMTEMRALV
ncbi:SDR family NAD(P)-dependent oxidoreductase [Poseidonocella sedimentorum]|uniref:Short-chain dehydrogenase n=1 Tax=Poseidonocella sedimentorum TaxID=871652 RepID=A0A1I6E3M0_9RHOB|nr:SDR family NAD(P)-dependent oxidoreductase [Poseidonocella sedimentorum]SFR12370.1 Short-chain dehydrogenase [Poseidonocella sedimentorum]